ncbi:MAG: prephenate dehydratase [Bacteroidales bacterium]|jgi:prephenate dehydratase|nr:prephenate dehydratase [Bacteroidales bacterium]MDD2571205.1 prephenate dehydratase [Bacteroidales bacterium]MDD2813224.1 prephenate dehydratase [Bacteroidales bacterium]MDD4812924.1 prephenate dehydratase [Bacteroidales bacterium]NLO69275.1 prephenate dehydratase [Bacteroidales bacterium]
MKKDKEKESIRVAIQGIAGSFHDQAAVDYFSGEQVELVPCQSFEDLFSQVGSGMADVAVMAIENTVAGSLLPNYALLRESGFRIFGELFLRISQHLMALPGQGIHDLSEVYSHYMAIAQTRPFFRSYPNIRLVESEDTAASARWVAEMRQPGKAAIAGERAAELYGLEILANGIETNKRNFTRFLFLYKPNGTQRFTAENPNKASLAFSLPHKTGSLSHILSIFSFYDINLTKIQSIPILGQEWEYHFLIDLTFDEEVRYRQALQAMEPLTTELMILGEYNQGRQIA